MLNINFFLINLSPTPIVYTLLLFFILNCLNNFSWLIISYKITIILIIVFFFYLIYIYFNIILNENFFIGFLTKKKKKIVSNGFLLFIISEIIVFISLFWSFIHNSFIPNIFIGNFWPPKGINAANPTRIIIFGTSILLSSRIIIIISHRCIIHKNFKKKTLIYFFFCLFIGLVFVDLQIIEIRNNFLKLNFNFNDRIFRNSFLFTISLHSTHVILGLIGLLYSYILLIKNFNSKMFFINFEIRIWYWHFVDYIWIFVFRIFYYLNN